MKKIITLLLSITMCITMIPMQVMATDNINGDPGQEETAISGKTVVICTGNIKGNIDFYRTVSGYENYFENQGATVVLADAGNYLHGSAYANFDLGNSVAKIMNETGYDVVALGTEEFAYGQAQVGLYHPNIKEQFLTFAKLFSGENPVMPNTKAIATNVANNGNENYAFDSRALAKDTQIGFVAVTDPETAEADFVDNMGNSTVDKLQFASGSDMYKQVNKAARRYKEAVPVICLANADVDEEKLGGCDYVFKMTADKAEAKAIVIDSENEIEEIALPESGTVDENVDSAVQDTKDKASAEGLFTSKSDIKGTQSAVRSGETPIGNLATDAIAWYAKQNGNIINDFIKENNIDYNNIVGLWNGGNLRSGIKAGDVTRVDVKNVIPFPNWVGVAKLTGAQLLETLEAGTQNAPGEDPAFPQISGIKYTVIAYTPVDKGDAYGKSWYKIKSVKRVRIDSVNGKKFDPKAVYAVVSSDKLLGGMDAYYMFSNNTDIYPEKIDKRVATTGVATAAEAVGMFVSQELNNTIPAAYAKTQGRIRIVKSAPKPPAVKGVKVAAKKIKNTSKKKNVVVSWIRNKSVSGYEVSISTKKSGTYIVKTIKSNSTVKMTKQYKKGKKLYVKVRTRIVGEDGKVYKGSWSAPKYIKVK